MAMRFWRSLVRGRMSAVSMALVLTLGGGAAASAAEEAPPDVCPVGEAAQHGTQIRWQASVDDAAREADERGKLVFVMQISGNFAREEFT